MVRLSPLHDAVEAGDVARVHILVAAGADIGKRQRDGTTPLYRAAEKGHAGIVRYLVERGADKEAACNGATPLLVAVKSGHHKVVRILIENGATKDATDKENWTAIMRACWYGHFNVVKYLLEQGCDINCVNMEMNDALHLAARKGRLDIAQVLLKSGAKLEVRNDEGFTPAGVAKRWGHQDINLAINYEAIRRRENEDATRRAEELSPLPSQLPDDAVNRGQPTLLFDVAIGSGNYIGEQALLAFPHAWRQHSTPHEVHICHNATAMAVTERVHLYVLPSSQPALVIEPVDATTVLIAFDVVPALGDAAIIGLADIQLHFGTHASFFPLPVAEREEVDATAAAAAVETPQHEQLMTLHDAVDTEDLACVQAAVAAGADIEEEGRGLWSFLPTPLFRAAATRNIVIAQYLMECGANTEAVNDDGETALHIAAKYDRIDVVRMLVEHGANKDAAAMNGFSPLSWAASNGHVAVVEYLIQQGCDKDHASDGVYTSLHHSAVYGNLDVAQLLLRFGAKLDVQTLRGETAADMATHMGHHDIADAIRAEVTRRRRCEEDEAARTMTGTKHQHYVVGDCDIGLSNIGDLTRLTPTRSKAPSSLYEAVEAGDLVRVQALLAAGASVEDTGGHWKLPALYLAAEEGHVAVVQYLIRQGAKKEATSPTCGSTALHIAAHHGYVEVVRVLIAHGANKDATCNAGSTPLMHASAYGHVAVAEYLLERRCDVNHADNNGWTALLVAAFHGRLEVTLLLLRFGAKLDLQNDDCFTAADYATEHGHNAVADAIRTEETRRAGVKAVKVATRITEILPLSEGVLAGELSMVKALIAAGGDIEERRLHYTPLYLAVKSGSVAVARYLAECGANKEVIVDSKGWTPLFVFVDRGHVEMVRMLIEQGANKDVVDQLGWTPITVAAGLGTVAMVECLLEQGCNVNHVNSKNGETALHWAVMSGHYEIVLLLLRYGAKLYVWSFEGESPLDIAVRYEHDDIVEAIRAEELQRKFWRAGAGAAGKTPDIEPLLTLHAAVEAGDLSRVRALVAAGADIEETRRMFYESGVAYEATPLFCAAWNGNVEMAQYLVRIGADIEATCNVSGDTKTVLGIAAEKGHFEVVQMLIAEGANKDAANEEIKAPLMIVAFHGQLQMAEFLLEHGCDMNCQVGYLSYTALHCAAQEGHLELVQLLLRRGAELELRDDCDRTPVQVASNPAVAQAIRAEYNRRRRDQGGRPAPADAARTQQAKSQGTGAGGGKAGGKQAARVHGRPAAAAGAAAAAGSTRDEEPRRTNRRRTAKQEAGKR